MRIDSTCGYGYFLFVLMLTGIVPGNCDLADAATRVTNSVEDPVQITQPLEDLKVGLGRGPMAIPLADRFDDPVIDLARFNTVSGTVDVKLFQKDTPLTVANFLNYVRKGSYTNSFIHRSAVSPTPFVIQGGGFAFYDFEDPDPEITDYVRIPTDPPVLNEPGISNLRGTIAMAKVGGNPDSATSQWFFNLSDNSATLDNKNNNGGFTVFGEVINNGMNVVDAIASVPVWNASVLNSAFNTLPLINYPGAPPYPDEKHLVMIHSIERVSELSFTAGSDHPELVQASVVENSLHLNFTKHQTGSANITVRATASAERFVEDSFEVAIENWGDLNDDDEVNLADAILALSIAAGMDPFGLRPDYSSSGADVNEDNRAGMAEAVFVLRQISQAW